MISSHRDQIPLLGAIVYYAARNYALLLELRKDVDTLQADNRGLLYWNQKKGGADRGDAGRGQRFA